MTQEPLAVEEGPSPRAHQGRGWGFSRGNAKNPREEKKEVKVPNNSERRGEANQGRQASALCVEIVLPRLRKRREEGESYEP